jgi:hypothetical protein
MTHREKSPSAEIQVINFKKTDQNRNRSSFGDFAKKKELQATRLLLRFFTKKCLELCGE